MVRLGVVAFMAAAVGAVNIQSTPTVVTTEHHAQVAAAQLKKEEHQAALSFASAKDVKAAKKAAEIKKHKSDEEEIADAKKRIEILKKIMEHPVIKHPEKPCVYDKLLKHPAAAAFMKSHAHSLVHPTHENILKSILAHVDPHHAMHAESTHHVLKSVLAHLGHTTSTSAHDLPAALAKHRLHYLKQMLDHFEADQHHKRLVVRHGNVPNHLAPHTNAAAHENAYHVLPTQTAYKEVNSDAAFHHALHNIIHPTSQAIVRGVRVHDYAALHQANHGLTDHDYSAYAEATHMDPCHGPHPYNPACDCKKGNKHYPACLHYLHQKAPKDDTESPPVAHAIPGQALEPGQHAAHATSIHPKGTYVVNPQTNQPEFVPAGGHATHSKTSAVSAKLHNLATAAAAAAGNNDGYVVIVDPSH
jgi:hypothetical protein